MKKLCFAIFLMLSISFLSAQNFRPGIVNESFNFSEVANIVCTPVSYVQSTFSQYIRYDSTKIKYNFNCRIIEKKDSFIIQAELLQFNSMISAFEYFCQYLLPGEKTDEIGWLTCYLDDSTAVSWYDRMILLSHFTKGEKPAKHLGKIFQPAKKLKKQPHFLNVFPGKQKIKNSIRYSSRGWMQLKSLKHVFYCEYENGENISRIFLIPVKKDSILLAFQEYLDFVKENQLLTTDKLPTDLPSFVAQDMFMGRLAAILYKHYIIGFMNYPSADWLRDRLKDFKNNLRKYPIYENQLK